MHMYVHIYMYMIYGYIYINIYIYIWQDGASHSSHAELAGKAVRREVHERRLSWLEMSWFNKEST